MFDGIYLMKDAHQLDLHNNFGFESLLYSVGDRRVTMRWRRERRAWVPLGTPERIEISFTEVSVFVFTPRDSNKALTDDDCVEELGYSSPGEGVPEYLVPVAPEPGWLMTFYLASGATISVGASHAHAAIGDEVA